MASNHEAYIFERLGEAVDALVANAGPVRDRFYRSAAHTRPLSRGANLCIYPHEPLISYRSIDKFPGGFSLH